MTALPSPASASAGTTLPLRVRLKRALLVALLLGLWAPAKIVWEQKINAEQNRLRYGGVVVTPKLRDQLGQGLTIGVLSGMRSIVADFVFLDAVTIWMHEEWFRMGACINLATVLQPRAAIFWDMGGWELAWNASVSALEDPTRPSELRRLKASRFWINRGLDIYLRGLEVNPGYWKLWRDTGLLYEQRLKDYPKAAWYYHRAAEAPGAPIFLERFPAFMYDAHHANDPVAAYAEWKELWYKLTPADKLDRFHEADRVEREIRKLENQLAIPREKRVFPN
jgi:hypothetical protein